MKNLLIPLFLCSLASASFAENSSHHDHGGEHHDHEKADHGHEKEHHGHEEEHSEHKAHLHGFAELEMALEGNQIEIAFESPAANIVGFEHRAESAEQRAEVESAKSTLEAPAQLFSFSDGNCRVVDTEVDMSALMPSEHDAHDAEHGDHKREQTHSEITAHYHFECEDGSQLSTLEVRLARHFPGLEKLNVMWVTDTRQGAVELTSKSNVVRFR